MDKPIFADKKLSPAKLAAFGFAPQGEWQIYHRAVDIPEAGRFAMTVRLREAEGAVEVQTQLLDADGGEYVLHRSAAAAGAFVGAVRAAHDGVLQEIADSCCEQAVFRAAQTLRLIEYVREHYGGELEFLWKKTPQAAIWRRHLSRKWYGLLMTVGRDKLGLAGDGRVEVLNLHCAGPEMAGRLAAGALPGYHMNKKYWFSVVLDGSLDFEVMSKWLEASWQMAGGR